MSILLEALRKSEKDQRKVEPPNIHSAVHRSSSSDFFKKNWVLLLIVVLLAGALYAWYQYSDKDEASQFQGAQTSEQGKVEGKQAVKPVESDTAGDKLAMVAGDVSNRQRTPVEGYEQSADTAAKAKPSKPTDQKKQAGNKTGTNKAAANKAATKKAANRAAARKVAAKKAADEKVAANKAVANKSAGGKPANTKPAAVEPKKFRPQPPAPISYWELPDAIRAKVPEMKFTVLVYAKKPADRFVLINGQRYRQGERVQPELFVREIRRAGVVFKYRLYLFLVER